MVLVSTGQANKSRDAAFPRHVRITVHNSLVAFYLIMRRIVETRFCVELGLIPFWLEWLSGVTLIHLPHRDVKAIAKVEDSFISQ